MTVAPAKLFTLDLLAPHQQYRLASGKRVPGVTTIISDTHEKPELYKWYWQMGKDGAEWDKTTNRLRYLDYTADLGSVIHARVEAHVRGYSGLDPMGIPDELLERSMAPTERFIERWEESGYIVVASEWQMVSEELRCGGTLDLMAVDRSSDLVLVDIKSSKPYAREVPYRGARIQVGGYVRLARENHFSGRPVRAEIWRVGREPDDPGSVHVITDLAAHEAAFESAVEHYYRMRKCR